jgi:serine O-acetyltransferase
MKEFLRADFDRYFSLLPPEYGRWQRFLFFLSCQGMWAILDYRFRRWLPEQKRWIRLLLLWPAFFAHIWVECLTGISIPTGVRIGKGLYIGHFSGIFLHPDVVMGENCSLSQGVTLGLGGKADTYGAPQVGDSFYFGVGTKVLGKISIGSNVRVGANAVVLSPIPAGATAVGVPAKVV